MKTAYDGQLAYVVCTQAMFKSTDTSAQQLTTPLFLIDGAQRSGTQAKR